MKHRRGWADGVALAALGILTVALYRQTVLTNLIWPGVDALTYFAPYRHYAAEVLRSGHVPLWNPYLLMGAPFLANPQTAVFYPLNWPLVGLDGPRIIVVSAVLHVGLMAAGAYAYARRSLRLGPAAAFLAAGVLAWGGYVGGMVEHINQLNVLAWFPLLLLLWDEAQRRWVCLLWAGAVVGLGLLAGHTQSSFISLVGLAVYAGWPLLPSLWQVARRKIAWRSVAAMWTGAIWRLAVIGGMGALLAAVQLLPTFELSSLSIRSGGLSYREVVAFSLKPLPRLLRYTFLPPWGANLGDVFGGDFFTEFVAWIGLVPMILVVDWLGSRVVRGLGDWVGVRKWLCAANWNSPRLRMAVLAGLGLGLSIGLYNPLYFVLYKIVPGWAMFRVPARWLFGYAFGAAMLTGMAWEHIARGTWAQGKLATAGRWGMWLLIGVTVGELFAAAGSLPLAHPTAPGAFGSWRTAPLHVKAAQQQEPLPGRVLSMSDMLFNPGDQPELHQMLERQLEYRAVYDYVVSAKRREVLTPNLPLSWRIYAVDGYDGGVLPLKRYVELQKLLLPEDRISPDGRLREQLKQIPPTRLLSLLGVRYVLTDKVNDVWIDGIFYDLAFAARLGKGETAGLTDGDLPDLEANALGIVAWVKGPVGENEVVAEIKLQTAAGEHVLLLYRKQVGETAEARQAVRLRWDTTTKIDGLQIVATGDGTLHVQGLTLIDERDGSNVPLLLSTDGRYRLVHSGDVKVYEVLDARPRAVIVHRARVLADDEQALAALADPSFDVGQEVILSQPGGPLLPDMADVGQESIQVIAYEPERVVLATRLKQPGYLVLGDAWYPGWQAQVDGQPVLTRRANLMFRAVYLEAGTHTVEWSYRPSSYLIGLGCSTAGWLGLAFIGCRQGLTSLRRRRRASLER